MKNFYKLSSERQKLYTEKYEIFVLNEKIEGIYFF